MVENVENTGLNKITVNEPTIDEQNKLIAQLFEKIAEMRPEINKTQNLMNPAIMLTFLLQTTKGLHSNFLLGILNLQSLT